MTVSSTTTRWELTADGATTSFPFNGKIFTASNLEVTLIAGSTLTTYRLAHDYAVNGVGNPNGGTVEFTTAPPAGTLVIQRVLPLTQATDLKNQGAFLPEVIEDAFDRQTMTDQQLEDQIKRAFKLPAATPIAGMNFTLPLPNPGSFFRWSQDGKSLVNRTPQQVYNDTGIQAAVDKAQLIAQTTGPINEFYNTKADAVAALPNLADGTIILVDQDESNSGITTRYTVSGGALTAPYEPYAASRMSTASGQTVQQRFNAFGSTATGQGSALVGDSSGATVHDLLPIHLQFVSYADLRNYSHISGVDIVQITGDGIAGIFKADPSDTTTADNGGTVIVANDGTRWKRDFTDLINVQWFGAVGDGATDDTAALQAAINQGSTKGIDVYVPPATYRATNLTHGSTALIGSEAKSTIIKALAGGDSRYLVASESWLATGRTTVSHPTRFSGIWLHGNNLKQYTAVIRAWDTSFKNSRISHATDTDICWSTDAADGTALTGSTMVNCEVDNCWLGVDAQTATYNMRTIDSASKATDFKITNNYMSGVVAAGTSLLSGTTAGWQVSGNHFYGGTRSVNLSNGNIGFRFFGNYCEQNAVLGSLIDNYDGISIGPSNFFAGDAFAAFHPKNVAGATDTMVFVGNVYASKLIHNWFSPRRVLVSENETFRDADPFQFYSNFAGSGGSTGVIKIKNATVVGLPHNLSANITGPQANAPDYLNKPADLYTSNRYAEPGTASWHNAHGALASLNKQDRQFITPANNAIAIQIDLPLLSGDSGFIVELDLGQRQNHTQAVRTTFTRRYAVIRDASSGAYSVVNLSEVYTASEWTNAPAISIADTTTKTTVNFTGQPSTTDGYGAAMMSVKNFI